MEHLKYLSWLNYLMGTLLMLLLLLLVLVVGLSTAFGVSAGAEVGDLIPGMVGPCVGGMVSGVLGMLFFMSGSSVARGKSRGLQTFLAVINLCGCPGIFYAGYALWVCYGNEATKAVFEDGGVIPE